MLLLEEAVYTSQEKVRFTWRLPLCKHVDTCPVCHCTQSAHSWLLGTSDPNLLAGVVSIYLNARGGRGGTEVCTECFLNAKAEWKHLIKMVVSYFSEIWFECLLLVLMYTTAELCTKSHYSKSCRLVPYLSRREKVLWGNLNSSLLRWNGDGEMEMWLPPSTMVTPVSNSEHCVSPTLITQKWATAKSVILLRPPQLESTWLRAYEWSSRQAQNQISSPKGFDSVVMWVSTLC